MYMPRCGLHVRRIIDENPSIQSLNYYIYILNWYQGLAMVLCDV